MGGEVAVDIEDAGSATPPQKPQISVSAVLVMTALVPYVRSDADDRLIASKAGAAVVTLTLNGAKSSATRCQILWMTSISSLLNVPGAPLVS